MEKNIDTTDEWWVKMNEGFFFWGFNFLWALIKL